MSGWISKIPFEEWTEDGEPKVTRPRPARVYSNPARRELWVYGPQGKWCKFTPEDQGEYWRDPRNIGKPFTPEEVVCYLVRKTGDWNWLSEAYRAHLYNYEVCSALVKNSCTPKGTIRHIRNRFEGFSDDLRRSIAQKADQRIKMAENPWERKATGETQQSRLLDEKEEHRQKARPRARRFQTENSVSEELVSMFQKLMGGKEYHITSDPETRTFTVTSASSSEAEKKRRLAQQMKMEQAAPVKAAAPRGSRHPNGGGWVDATATVAPTAYVGPMARVEGHAKVLDEARVEGSAVVKDRARVLGGACISGGAEVSEDAVVQDNVRVLSNAKVGGSVRLSGSVEVAEEAVLEGKARLQDYVAVRFATIRGTSLLRDHVQVVGRSEFERVLIEGNPRLSDRVQVRDEALISGNVRLADRVEVCSLARVKDNANLSGRTRVMGQAEVRDDATLKDNVEIRDQAVVKDHARVEGDASVEDEAEVGGTALMFGKSKASQRAKVGGDCEISGYASVVGSAKIWGDAWLNGDCIVGGESDISGNAHISDNTQVFDTTMTGDTEVEHSAEVTGSILEGKARVGGDAFVKYSQLSDNVQVKGDASVVDCTLEDKVVVKGDAKLKGSHRDELVFQGNAQYGGDFVFEGQMTLNRSGKFYEPFQVPAEPVPALTPSEVPLVHVERVEEEAPSVLDVVKSSVGNRILQKGLEALGAPAPGSGVVAALAAAATGSDLAAGVRDVAIQEAVTPLVEKALSGKVE